MRKRLIFLGMAVFFAMVTAIGFAFIQTHGRYFHHWFTFFFGIVCMVLSLVGVICPGKMQWFLDACKKKNKEA